MGCDVCYTVHCDADSDDVASLLTLLGAAGCNFIMGVPGADDIMLHYQSTSFHDALYLRQVLGLKPAPEFEDWLESHGLYRRSKGRIEAQPTLKLCSWDCHWRSEDPHEPLATPRHLDAGAHWTWSSGLRTTDDGPSCLAGGPSLGSRCSAAEYASCCGKVGD